MNGYSAVQSLARRIWENYEKKIFYSTDGYYSFGGYDYIIFGIRLRQCPFCITIGGAVRGALPSDFVEFYMNVGKSNYSSNATSALVLDIRMARENPAYDEKVTEALYNDALVNTIKV